MKLQFKSKEMEQYDWQVLYSYLERNISTYITKKDYVSWWIVLQCWKSVEKLRSRRIMKISFY